MPVIPLAFLLHKTIQAYITADSKAQKIILHQKHDLQHGMIMP